MNNETNTKELRKLNLQFFADDGDNDDDQKDDKKADDKSDDNPPNDDHKKQSAKKDDDNDDKYVPQSKVDEIVQKRIAREREKYGDYDELKTKLSELEKAEDERKKAQMSEQERLQAEKDEAIKRAEEAKELSQKAIESANQRILNTEIKAFANALNANDTADVLAFIDKSSVTIDDDGNVTGAKEAVEAVKESKPYLFKAASTGADASGGSNAQRNHDPNAGDGKKLAELAEKARGTGRTEDKVAYVTFKREMEAKKK